MRAPADRSPRRAKLAMGPTKRRAAAAPADRSKGVRRGRATALQLLHAPTHWTDRTARHLRGIRGSRSRCPRHPSSMRRTCSSAARPVAGRARYRKRERHLRRRSRQAAPDADLAARPTDMSDRHTIVTRDDVHVMRGIAVRLIRIPLTEVPQILSAERARGPSRSSPVRSACTTTRIVALIRSDLLFSTHLVSLPVRSTTRVGSHVEAELHRVSMDIAICWASCRPLNSTG